MRFRPEQHLSHPRDIREVRETGRRYDCRAFTIWWKMRPATSRAAAVPEGTLPAAPTLSRPRVCVIASTAAVGNAVLRNRAKRRLREIFRQRQDLLPSACDLLLIARRETTTWPMSELGQKFVEACQRLAPAASRRGTP